MCCKQMGWVLVCVWQPRATCSLDLYELSMFMCICWGRRWRKRLLRADHSSVASAVGRGEADVRA